MDGAPSVSTNTNSKRLIISSISESPAAEALDDILSTVFLQGEDQDSWGTIMRH